MNFKWIPVEEKLPEAKSNYLVTVKLSDKHSDDDYSFVCIDHYNGKGEWTNHNKKDNKVIVVYYEADSECYDIVLDSVDSILRTLEIYTGEKVN